MPDGEELSFDFFLIRRFLAAVFRIRDPIDPALTFFCDFCSLFRRKAHNGILTARWQEQTPVPTGRKVAGPCPYPLPPFFTQW